MVLIVGFIICCTAFSGAYIVLSPHIQNINPFSKKTATNTQWNLEMASYLAHRALLDPTQADIDALLQAGSASAATQLLLGNSSTTDMQAYTNGLQSLNTVVIEKNTNNHELLENTQYAYQLIHDPNRVQRKLYYLWENTFSVDQQIDPGDVKDKIDHVDMLRLDAILYAGAFGNYIDMVKQVQTSFAMGKYLDLIISNQKNPNENYSREVMQLFLMGQYTPLDTAQTTANYSEADVNSLGYLLTGYHGNPTTHEVAFSPKLHYSGQKMFLGENVSFSDPMQAIDYIVQKRHDQISLFLANKLLKYYVSDTPQPEDISTFARVISDNNFEIKPSVEWLFSSQLMYRQTYMQEDRYRSPLELVASLYTTLFGRDTYTIAPFGPLLSALDFTPWHPGSVFGRQGFVNNADFYSGSILDAWIGNVDRVLRKEQYKAAEQQFFTTLIQQKNITTASQLVEAVSNHIYDGKTLPQSTINDVTNYITLNHTISDTDVLNIDNTASFNRLLGMLNLLFAQPEFIMNGGNYSAVPFTAASESSSADSKLIVVRLHGGLDYQQLVANQSDTSYAANRGALTLSAQNALPLGQQYLLNSAAASLQPFIKNHQLSFVTAVGLPGLVRAHDIASTQMETGLAQDGLGIGAALKKSNSALSFISLTSDAPIFYRGATSLEMGPNNLTLFPKSKAVANSSSELSAALKKILQDRKLPVAAANFYAQSFLLDTISAQNSAAGGLGAPGPKNNTQLPFLAYLIDHNIGDVYYVKADESYDTHAGEEPRLDSQIKDLTTSFTNLFSTETAKGKKVTIVFFSEFGRTDKVNGSDGTDHGTGGGMLVLSNVLHWPTMIGTLHPSTDVNNWTTIEVDARDVWSSIFGSLYKIPTDTFFGKVKAIESYPVTIP